VVVPWNYYSRVPLFPRSLQEEAMNGIIYLIGLIVVILAILSFFGLR
jgi:predicted membrane channel-forming protein YqfA (hemolysin III family)